MLKFAGHSYGTEATVDRGKLRFYALVDGVELRDARGNVRTWASRALALRAAKEHIAMRIAEAVDANGGFDG